MTRRPTIFALVREGTSDDALIPHLQELLVREGLPEVIGQGRNYPGSVIDKLKAVKSEESSVDLIFVHRDADTPQSDSRRSEIKSAAERVDLTVPVVPLVPVQELEAWLLVDEGAIRLVAGKPAGREALGLPALSRLEHVASPKDVLKAALLKASESSGRRKRTVKNKFPEQRRTLLERLEVDGPLRSLSAWKQLEHDIAEVVKHLQAT